MSGFTIGQRVWLQDGRKAEFVADTPEGIVVRFGFYRPGDMDGENEYYGGVDIVRAVLAEPPVEAIDARVSALLAKEVEARARLDAIRTETRDAERDAKERLQKLAKHPPLDMLEALIEGKVTHFAVKSEYHNLAHIETFEEATTWVDKEFGRNRKELRMLALVGSRDMLAWKINTYGDGSGQWKATVWPCLSYEDALKKVAEFCLAAAAELKPGQINSRHYSVCENAKKHGIEIPQWIPDAVAECRAQNAQKEIDKAAAALAFARAKAGAEPVSAAVG